MLVIRMRKMGSKKRPFFRVVVTDSRAARDSSFVEIVGHYNPRLKPAKVLIDRERIDPLGWEGREAVRHGPHAAEAAHAHSRGRGCHGGQAGWSDGVTAVRDVIETVAKALADSPQRVSVTETEHSGTTLVEVSVAPPDVGKLIGRQGRTIQAMRTIAAMTGERLGKKVNLEVRD